MAHQSWANFFYAHFKMVDVCIYFWLFFYFTGNPFILTNIQGFPCQKVCGTKVTPISVESFAPAYGFDEENLSEIRGETKPAGKAVFNSVMLHFCYYQKMEDSGINY